MTVRFGLGMLLGGVVAAFGAAGAGAQAGRPVHPASAKASVGISAVFDAILMSDIHFDVFRDPSKAERLVDAPVSDWERILGEADAPGVHEAWAALQKGCNEVAIDTPYTLLESSLAAMKAKAPEAKFALLSGDVLVHNLPCRFRSLLPGRPESDYQALTVKTEQFVLERIRRALPGMPVYVALGNNDTSCRNDYSIDPDSPFFAETKDAVLGWLPAGPERKALASYSRTGDYAVTMLKPMRRTRLIVLNDLYQSYRYKSCDGTPPAAAAVDAEIAWLGKELAGAKQRGERVWVMGHIPAGIDSYSTLRQNKKVCAEEQPVMFLSSERLAEVMAKYADVIKLGVFAHSHMDEMRLFGAEPDGVAAAGAGVGFKGKVAIKMVPSISPLASFVSQFTVARVDAGSARMVDYTVYVASNMTGVDAAWSKVYSYGDTYHAAEYSPTALDGLIRGFEADPKAQDAASVAYLSHVVGGEKGLMLKSLWPQYACVMEHHSAAAYKACVCGAP